MRGQRRLAQGVGDDRDFVAAGEKVKAKTGKAMINVDVNGSDSIWSELMQQQGASYFNAAGQVTVNGPEAVKAMTLLKTLYDKGLIDNEKGWDARVAAAKAAALVPAIMNAVTEVGAPSYTSGAHMWNGTDATLKANPTSSNPPPATSRGPGALPSARTAATRRRTVVPVAP